MLQYIPIYIPSISSNRLPNNTRLLVGISGVPASGKSTLAELVAHHINALQVPHEAAILVGLDGWHFTRAQLDAFPDPKLAHDRRGAHWTFDGESYAEFVRQLRKPLASDNNVIHAPSFSHSLKDPTPRSVSIYPHHKLVIIEGLYTFLSIPPWKEAGGSLDERWWVEINEEEAEKRLVKRHVLSGVAKDMEEAVWRSRENDAPSESVSFVGEYPLVDRRMIDGRFIKENMLPPTRTILSVEDPELKSKELGREQAIDK